MASNPCPGQAGGIPKLTSSDFKPVDCNVEYAATKKDSWVSTAKYWQVDKPYSQDTGVTSHHKIQILWVQRKGRDYCKEAAAGCTNQLQKHTKTSG